MQIPDAELDVVAVLWKQGPATAMEIRERLAKRRKLSHASVSTLLRRLEDKGLVQHQKGSQGKAFVFRATKPAATRKQLMKDFLDRVFDGCGIELVSTLLRSSQPTDEELDQLQEMLDATRDKAKTRKGQ